MDDEEPIPSDAELRKRLFSTPAAESKPEAQEEGQGSRQRSRSANRTPKKAKRKRPKQAFRLGLLAVLLFLLLCALAVIVTLQSHEGWKEITVEGMKEGIIVFFSNQPMREGEQVQYPLFGLLGALPLAAAIASCTGAFTCLFMYYDSDIPGEFPPTPVSPRKDTDPSPYSSKWHLGYIFVPVNTLVAFTLALFYLRLSVDLPIV